ncbi:acyltransferase family protein [Agromyces sp. MMS24-JH15]|uniref:acyltransferase family protein n=1 Tax=Agromyces sp. MMS24-JH15 TaxID=3243765 RepID=UPI00374A1F02
MGARTVTGSRGIYRTDIGRKSWMDLAKGVAIILVVVYHGMLFLHSIGFEGDGMTRSKVTLETFPMPVFFLIAGMFGLRIQQWTFAETWKRKISGYLYLYVVWSVIRFLFYLVVPNVRAGDGAGTTASDPISLLLIFVWPTSSYWFILALAVFTVAFWLIRRLPVWLQVGAAAVLSVLFSSDLLDTGNVGWTHMCVCFVFFVVGALFSKRIEQAVLDSKGWHIAAAFAGYALVTASLAFVPWTRDIPGVVLLGQVSAVALGATVSVRLVRLRALAWVGNLGVRSFEIYLLHVFVLAGLGVLLSAFPVLLTLPDGGWGILIVMVAIAIWVSLLLFRVLARFPWLFVSPLRMPSGAKKRRAAGPGAGTGTDVDAGKGADPAAGEAADPAATGATPVPGADGTR